MTRSRKGPQARQRHQPSHREGRQWRQHPDQHPYIDQRNVLSGVVMGKSLKTIAEEAGVAETVIEAVRAEILRRFGFRTTADLIRLGIYAGMTD